MSADAHPRVEPEEMLWLNENISLKVKYNPLKDNANLTARLGQQAEKMTRIFFNI